MSASSRARYPRLDCTFVPSRNTTMYSPLNHGWISSMRITFTNRKIYDDSLDISHPEMIIYAPASDGKMKLVAVEYVVPFRLRPPTATPPRLFGQELKRHEEYKYWYLHVWAWEKNPAGLFADWNPLVKC